MAKAFGNLVRVPRFAALVGVFLGILYVGSPAFEYTFGHTDGHLLAYWIGTTGMPLWNCVFVQEGRPITRLLLELLMGHVHTHADLIWSRAFGTGGIAALALSLFFMLRRSNWEALNAMCASLVMCVSSGGGLQS